MNLNSQIDWNDTDRIVSNDTRYVSLNGDWWRESSSWQMRQNGSPTLTRVGLNRTSLTGLGGNTVPSASSPTGADTGILTSETRSLDSLGNETVSCTYLDRSSHTSTQTTTTPASSLAAVATVQSGLTISSRSPTGVTTTYAYDALGRQTAQTDGRGNTSQIVYDPQGRVTKTIDALGNETTYAYDALGRQTSVTDPLGHTVTTIYDAEGRVLAQRGATYPVDYAYDAYGNKVAMTTYREEPECGGLGETALPATDDTTVGRDRRIAPLGDTTRWFYDEPSGCMTNKVYADGKGPSYDYTPDGKLARRTWARGIVTDYTYDNAGNLTRTEYDDNSVTPTITTSYDRVGNLVNATTAGVVTNLYAYDLYGHCTNEWQNDFNLARYYDTIGRSTGYAINGERQTTIGYDSYGRIATMSVPSGQSNNPNNRTILRMTYDHMGRRREKNDQRFFYDGYLQIANNSGNVYAWDCAEPVATRPLTWFNSARYTSHPALYYAHDGNKNVSEVIAADCSLAAHYDYAPFGDVATYNGRWGASMWHGLMAVPDVCMVRAGLRLASKGMSACWKTGSHTWRATRSWYGKKFGLEMGAILVFF